jgi:long-chain acyl-CoA synthetase
MALTPDDVVLGTLPFSHSYGLNGALLASLLAGASVVALERFVPDEVLDAVAAHRVTVLPAVATMFRRLLSSPALERGQLASVRMALSGAAPCPWDLACEWRQRTGVRIYRGYGSTELFRPLSYLATDADDRPDAIGRPVPGVEVRIVDDDGGVLPAGEPGELSIRSPASMDGYLDAPEETREVLVDGWFRTGDLARVSADGWVTIEGRKRERILRGGYSVFPQEIEAVLLAHPAVGEAAVVGVPHEELGEEVAAWVALRRGQRAGVEELIDHCRRQLATFKCPRQITIVPELPKAATGKVLKRLLAGPR